MAEDTQAGAQDTFISHLVELRNRLVRAVAVVLVVFLVLVAVWPGPGAVYDFIARPMMIALAPGLLPCLWFQVLRQYTVGMQRPQALLLVTPVRVVSEWTVGLQTALASAARIGELAVRPWLLTILRNTARNAARDAARRPGPPPAFEPAPMPEPLRAAVNADCAASITLAPVSTRHRATMLRCSSMTTAFVWVDPTSTPPVNLMALPPIAD